MNTASSHTVVNVAGIGGFKHTHQTDMAHWSRFIDINLSGTFRVILNALPHLVDTESPIPEAKKSKGKAIINVASQAAMKAHPYAAGYCASKGGVSDAHEGARRRVRLPRTARERGLPRRHQDSDPL